MVERDNISWVDECAPNLQGYTAHVSAAVEGACGNWSNHL